MKEKTINIILLAVTLAFAAVLEILRTTLHVLPLAPLSPSVMYVLGVVVTLVLLADVFVCVRVTKICRTVRMALLAGGAVVNLLFYYVLKGENTLYFFPMLAVAYFAILIKTEE